MAKPITDSRFRKALKKTRAPQTGWLDVFPAILGRADGTVITAINGVVWVRNILNGQLLAVYNSAVPNIPLLQVEVGRRVDQPGLWQVKGTIESFNVPASSSSSQSVGDHHEQHEFPNSDTIWVDRKQVMQLNVVVLDPENFIVRVYGAPFVTNSNTLGEVETQPVDLSSYVPTEGAVFVTIQSDDDGVLSVLEGIGFASPFAGTKTDVPAPDMDHKWVAYILLHEAMTELSNDDIRIPYQFGGGGGADASNFRRVVMATGITHPPVPVENAEGDDWIYSTD